MSVMKEFRDFAIRGNMVDLAVGIIIGAAFTTVVNSLVSDLIMPPIGLAMGGQDFKDQFVVLKSGVEPEPYATLEAARAAGAVTLNFGVFLNTVVTFLIVCFVVFLLVRGVNRLRREPAPTTTRPCPYCRSDIPLLATRCPHCTSEVSPA